MAKDKVMQYPLRDCKECELVIKGNEKLYCPFRLQYKHILKDSGVVVKQHCGFYKGKA